ncbi:MAG: transglycosylase domain-containing protein [Bacteroidales bacterium]|nr:transglycosylase domain-containing protein [Bacteroidales bacterium]
MSNRSHKRRKYTVIFWLLFSAPILFAFLLFFTISIGLWGFMPSFEELENPKSNLASEIYSADGELLGTFYIHNRSNVNYSDISPNMINALLATEDIRFRYHSGVDIRSIFRVLFRNIIGGRRSAGGGSTLSQQLAKNLFPRQENPSVAQIVIIKLKEWVTAAKLERNYTKDEIIAMYLNTVDFGSHAFGVKLAAKTYFNTTPDELKAEEAALLVGMLKAPSWYHPVRNPGRALNRRQVVLAQMARYEFITVEEYDSLRTLPLDMSKFQIQDQHTGIATYFREHLRNELSRWSRTRFKPDGTNYDIYRDGLKIYTTIDSRMQRYAEEAVAQHMGHYLQPEFFRHWRGFENAPFDTVLSQGTIDTLILNTVRRSDRFRSLRREGVDMDSIMKNFEEPRRMRVFSWQGDIDTIMTPLDSIWYYKHFLNAGFMAVEPHTGHVKAYVGGNNFRHFKYDHVTGSRRQVGSVFKPFLYTLAMQEGEFGPCTKVPNTPVTFELWNDSLWTPRNSSDDREGEMVTLQWALANSTNYISAFLMKRYSPEAVIRLIRRMGVKSHIPPVYAIALGTPDLSLYEIVGANATYANKGVYIEPTFVTRIEDQSGNLIEAFMPHREEAMSEETAWLMLELMKGVVLEGTGRRLRWRYGFNNPIAGKTGTTQSNSDGWFVGITPDLVAASWVGGEDRGIRFRTLALGQGANTALPIWAKFMTRVYADDKLNISKDDFEPPLYPPTIETDCSKVQDRETPRDYFRRDIF